MGNNFYRRGFGKALVVGGLALILHSCKPDNNAPVNSINPSPISGEVPLKVNMVHTYNDLDGLSDVVDQSLIVKNTDSGLVDTSIVGSSPIPNFSYTFKTPGKREVTYKVTDSHGDVAVATASIDVHQNTFMNLNTELVDYNKVKLSAVLSKVPKATLNVKKGNNIVYTKEISDVVAGGGVDFTATLDYPNNGFTKGEYTVEVVDNDLDAKIPVVTSVVIIPNYSPTMSLSGLNIDLREYSQVSKTLPATFFDNNPEDVNLASYLKVTPLDNKTNLSLNGNIITVISSKDLGAYSGKIEFGSVTGGFGEAIFTGNVLVDSRKKVYAYQLEEVVKKYNWYGSGDVINDGVRNGADLDRLLAIINGTFADPNDRWLIYRCDINGSGGVPTLTDYALFKDFIDGKTSTLPGDFDKLPRSQGEDWLTKMIAIENLDRYNFPGGNCNEISNQFKMDMTGFNKRDLANLLATYNYDTTRNGLFHIPVFTTGIIFYGPDGKIQGGHAAGAVFFGEDATIPGNMCKIEPQYHEINYSYDQFTFNGAHVTYSIMSPPTTLRLADKIVDFATCIGFNIVNGVSTIHPYESEVVKFMPLKNYSKK